MPRRNDLDDTSVGGENPTESDVISIAFPANHAGGSDWLIPRAESSGVDVSHGLNPETVVRATIATDGTVLRSVDGGNAEWADGLSSAEVAKVLVLFARRLLRAKAEREALAAALVTARQERTAIATALANLKQRVDNAGIP